MIQEEVGTGLRNARSERKRLGPTAPLTAGAGPDECDASRAFPAGFVWGVPDSIIEETNAATSGAASTLLMRGGLPRRAGDRSRAQALDLLGLNVGIAMGCPDVDNQCGRRFTS